MTTTRGRRFTTFVRRQGTVAAVLVAATGAVAATTAGVASAQSAPQAVRHRVVEVSVRPHFGKIITTLRGRALYVLPHGTCGSGCLAFWPPLLMPRGTTIPTGTRCLGTARFGHRLQVTYRERRLYLFVNDSGHSVNGNGQQGFFVARFSTRPCPA